MNSTLDTERNFSFDILKALAIFLVVTYHIAYWRMDFITGSKIACFHYFLQCTLGVHVPIFFLVNGALLMNKPFSVIRHTHKTIHLLVITVFHCAITLFLMSIIYNDVLDFKGFIYQLKTWENGWIQHLWFLQQLFILYLLFFLIKPAFEHQRNAVKIFLLLFGIMAIGNGMMTIIANVISIRSVNALYSANIYNFFQNFNPFPSSRGGFLFYFLLGGVIASGDKQISCKKKAFVFSSTVLLLSTGIVYLYGLYFSFSIQKPFNIVGNNYFSPCTVINVICIYVLSVCLSDALKKSKTLTKLITLVSKNTMGIYLIHWPIAKFVSFHIVRSATGNFLLVYITAFLILAVSLAIALCMKKIPVIRKLYSL